MQETYKLFEDWSSQPISVETQRAYERATQKLALCTPFEEKIVRH